MAQGWHRAAHEGGWWRRCGAHPRTLRGLLRRCSNPAPHDSATAVASPGRGDGAIPSSSSAVRHGTEAGLETMAHDAVMCALDAPVHGRQGRGFAAMRDVRVAKRHQVSSSSSVTHHSEPLNVCKCWVQTGRHASQRLTRARKMRFSIHKRAVHLSRSLASLPLIHGSE